jgi:hypothetical protein
MPDGRLNVIRACAFDAHRTQLDYASPATGCRELPGDATFRAANWEKVENLPSGRHLVQRSR